jgi:hypothetical protein
VQSGWCSILDCRDFESSEIPPSSASGTPLRLSPEGCQLYTFILPVLHNSTLPLTSVLEFHEHSKKEEVCEFLQSIRNMNPDGDIVIIRDNFRSHHANRTREFAEANRIQLVFSPPYSPDLNPIEFIWKGLEE